jgi:hypothetical protein
MKKPRALPFVLFNEEKKVAMAQDFHARGAKYMDWRAVLQERARLSASS